MNFSLGKAGELHEICGGRSSGITLLFVGGGAGLL